MPPIKPLMLRQGDQIGVIAPAGPVAESDLQLGLQILESSGFRPRLGSHIYDRQGYLAGHDEARLSDLHMMFQNPEVKAVFCARGGYGCLRLLDKIHYDLIRGNPKILMGYSDITALLLAVFTKSGLVTFHGPVIRELAHGDPANWESVLQFLCSKQPYRLNLREGVPIVHGKVRGPLIGGNLSLICHLVGTPFLPSLKGCILFLEERGESTYRLDRMLTHLRLSGRLKGLKGLILGQLKDCGDPAEIIDILLQLPEVRRIPFVTGLPVGHGSKNLTLPIGLTAELDTGSMTLAIMGSGLKS